MRLCLVTYLLFTAALSGADAPPGRIAFGSCVKQMNPVPIWDAVIGVEPGLFVFLGDNIYGDTDDMTELREKWRMLGAQIGYQRLRTTCPIIATWDDHDYGRNDAGSDFPHKRASQELFLDFFEEPAVSARRQREGVYHSWSFGSTPRRLQVILLDTRYFRSPLRKGRNLYERGEGRPGVYLPKTDPEATLLGEEQWRWLEQQLQQPADLRLIGSSIQLISNEHRYEKWGNLPRERERFLNLLRRSRAGGVIVLSGDRHSAEISRMDAGLGYPLYDITSSSLNQSQRWANELNPHRIGSRYHEENFGMITVDWEAVEPVVRLQIRDLHGRVVMQVRHPLGELQPR